ncbi:unnamed protein product, partial [Sphenostylis stenocarpa]
TQQVVSELKVDRQWVRVAFVSKVFLITWIRSKSRDVEVLKDYIDKWGYRESKINISQKELKAKGGTWLQCGSKKGRAVIIK